MLNPYACPHPLNRLRQSNTAVEWMTCQDCLSTFNLGLACGHNLHGTVGESTQGKTWRLVMAMRDDSQDTLPLKDFIPAGVTVEQLRPTAFSDEAEESKDRTWRPPGRA